MGVGLMEGFQKGVNWKMFAKQFASWVSTLFVVGLGVGAIFAQVRGGWMREALPARVPAVLMWLVTALPPGLVAALHRPLGGGVFQQHLGGSVFPQPLAGGLLQQPELLH